MTTCRTETPSRINTDKYSHELKTFIDYWFNDFECQILRNNINNLTEHPSNIHMYRTSLTPNIQNKLKRNMHAIDEEASIVDKTITYKLKGNLHDIFLLCNAFTRINGNGNDDEILDYSKQIQTYWFDLIANIQNLYACSIAS